MPLVATICYQHLTAIHSGARLSSAINHYKYANCSYVYYKSAAIMIWLLSKTFPDSKRPYQSHP